MKYVFACLALCCALHGKEKVFDQQENEFQTSTSYKVAPNVNPITGDLIEEETDLVVAGIEPLSIRRFYSHSGVYEPRYGGWRYNPESYLVANFENTPQETFAAVGTHNGGITPFKPSSGICTFDSKGYASFNPSGQTHPLNTKITYRKINSKEKGYFRWQGEVVDGSGCTRFFESNTHCWLTCLIPEIKHTLHGLEYVLYYPSVWTPYQLPIHEERKPNGNIICYTYESWKKHKLFPRPSLLSTITAYNADKTKVLGSITFHYTKDKPGDVRGISVVGSDGRSTSMQHQGSTPIYLHSIESPDKPSVAYGYQKWLNRVEKPDGRIVTTEYNADEKVAAQYAPVGPHGEIHPIARYSYSKNMTQVIDAEGNRTDYHFDNNKQLKILATLKDCQVYRAVCFDWDSKGNCLRKTIKDRQNIPLRITEYAYDKNQNPILEKTGDGKEWHTITRTFSEDGFNLKLSEEDRKGKAVCYNYVPGTNLLASELTYENKTIRKRIFHTYDDCAVCIKTIIDDGSSPDPNDLKGVSYRKITEVKPKQTLPCFGLPEEVSEKTIDSVGREILLKKVKYTYAPFGKVLTEEHYDAEGKHRYTISNTYDEKERLIATTDPLGNSTQFTYDVNNNLLSITGPSSDKHKEITYDKANRPTRIADWQSDGTILTIEKQYDRLGQVIIETDTCGNETHFLYDMLGRVLLVRHPDGALEKKEYDELDNLVKETDPKGYETRKEYNYRGQPTAIYYPDGQEERFTYNSTGTVASHIDKNGAKTLYTYDIFDHPIKTQVYSSSGELVKTTTATYSPFCKLSETDGEGVTTTYTYDYCGRKIAEQTGNKKTHYSYDSLGRLAKTTTESFQTIEEYDNANQLIAKKILSDTLQFQEAYAYDPSGNRTHLINSYGAYETLYNTFGKPLVEKNPLNFSTTYAYHFGKERSESITDANGISTLHIYDVCGREKEASKKNKNGACIAKALSAYDKNGNLTEQIHTVFDGVKPVKTITHHWEYGPMGRLERFIEAGEKVTRYVYDAKGRLATIVKPSGIELHHEWDDFGRLKRYYSSDFDYTYAYDRNDRLLSVYDAVSQTKTSRSYDDLGNIIQEVLGNGLELTNTYDNQGRRLVLTLPDHSKIEYAYKGAYLYKVIRRENAYTYASRDLEGNLLRAEFPSSRISITRDALSRWESIESPHYKARNTYDPVGNLLRYDFQDACGKVECAYQYDDHYQLISENEHTYHFDSLHNRLKKDDLAHQVNNFCQTVHDGRKAYEYDADGNLVFDGEWRYQYDTQDRLIALENDTQRIVYTYDPFHRRLSKTVNGESINYIWDGDNEIGAVSEEEIIQLRVLGEGLGAEIGAAAFYELNGKTYVPIHNHRGCVVALADTNGQTIENYRYTAFGEELIDNQLSPWRFSSKRTEEETGLVFFGRRYYQPELGRWITQDPEGFEDGPNLYAYLHNSPLTDFDPYGLLSWGGLWNGTRDALYGVGSYMWSSAAGMGYSMAKMGEWMYADFQYEYFNDRSFFQDKSYQAVEGWKNLGRAAWDDPLSMVAPGIMEAWRDPTSPAAWGKAAVDVGLMCFTAAKVGGSIANLGKAGRIGGEFATFGKAGNAIGKIGKKTSILENHEITANGFLGHRGWELKYPKYQNFTKNTPGMVGSRKYIGHAFDQMQNRGIVPSVVENTIKNGISSPNRVSGRMQFYDSINNISVITENGEVVTVMHGKPR